MISRVSRVSRVSRLKSINDKVQNVASNGLLRYSINEAVSYTHLTLPTKA